MFDAYDLPDPLPYHETLDQATTAWGGVEPDNELDRAFIDAWLPDVLDEPSLSPHIICLPLKQL